MKTKLSLLDAVSRRELDAVTAALDEDPTLERDDAGETAVHKAARNGDIEILKAILKRQPNVNLFDLCGWTPLMLAAGEGHVEIVRLLLARDASPNPPTSDMDETALSRACEHGHVEIVKLLLEAGAVLLHEGRYRPLIVAARQGHTEIVTRLCAAGAHLEEEDYRGYTPLIAAARGGHIDTVKSLVDLDAKILSRAVVEAGLHGHRNVVLHLLSRGGEFPYGFLTRAAESGRADLISLALECGARVTERHGYRNRTPLAAAIASGSHESVALLLKAGANIYDRDLDQVTCLELAETKGDDAMRALLEPYIDEPSGTVEA